MKKGFTLLEMIIALAVSCTIALAIYGAFRFFSISLSSNNFKTLLLKEAQQSMAYLTKDIGYAINIDNSYLPGLGLGYANGNDKICIRIPSVDQDFNPIVDLGDGNLTADPPVSNTRVTVGYYSDYVYFWKDGTQIKKKMIINTGTPAVYKPSARAADSGQVLIVANDVYSLTFSDYSAGTSGQTLDQIIASYGTDTVGLTTRLESITKLGITVTFQKTAPNSKSIIKTLKTQVYALRNKTPEFVS